MLVSIVGRDACFNGRVPVFCVATIINLVLVANVYKDLMNVLNFRNTCVLNVIVSSN